MGYVGEFETTERDGDDTVGDREGSIWKQEGKLGYWKGTIEREGIFVYWNSGVGGWIGTVGDLEGIVRDGEGTFRDQYWLVYWIDKVILTRRLYIYIEW